MSLSVSFLGPPDDAAKYRVSHQIGTGGKFAAYFCHHIRTGKEECTLDFEVYVFLFQAYRYAVKAIKTKGSALMFSRRYGESGSVLNEGENSSRKRDHQLPSSYVNCVVV